MNASKQLSVGTCRDFSAKVKKYFSGYIPAYRHAASIWRAVLLATLTCFASAVPAATLVHDFYLPMPEAQIRQTFVTLETNVSTTLDSVFSVVVTGTGTVIYYDQWEDGYETDLANPTQSSTQIWGDGNNANGIPPGFVNDPVGLSAGTVLALRNLVPLPRNPSTLLFDARDRMAATKALVVSRAAWATTPGPVLSGAVEVTATIDYGTSYISPVGQNLTNRLFQYVGFMIMAEQDNTSVTIDLDGTGTNSSPFVVALNRGESYLVNGGVKIGGSVNSTKPVQVNLVIGRYAGKYATDWFTLYPTNQWSDSYITPVGTAANGNQTYNYFYNPNSTNITINYLTRVGSGSFSVPAGGVTQYQMPQSSGAKFTSVGGANFFALCTAGANPSSDTAYDWGFTLLPADGLTTEAVVGWGPGSSDGTVNGSPVWVTPVAATRVYVDFNGDHNGPLTDPNGNKYDTNFNLAALESKTVYDPDKDQTAMRLYTVDGTVLSTAWGEDPSVAGAGNPYLDFGTTVLPFPVPVLRKTFVITNDIGTPGLSVGDTLEYTLELDNRGLLPLGNTVVIDSLPTNMLAYVTNSTTFNGNSIPDSVTGTKFPLDETGYTIPVILRGGTSNFKFRVTTLAAGNITNVVSAVGYSLTASAVATPPPGGGSTQCGLNFANAAGSTVVSYPANTNIYVRLTDADANTSSGSAQTVSVVVQNLTSSDVETIVLTETGNNTGIFQNTTPLPSSVAGGLFQQDGTLNARPSDLLQVNYTDPVYADACAANAVIQVPALTKVLYLSGTNAPDQNLDRIDPVATGDNTTAQSVPLVAPSSGTVTFDALSTNSALSPFTSISVPHTTGSGANRLMLVTIAYEDDNTAGPIAISGITYAGQSLTRVAGLLSPQEAGMELWQLLNPPSGTGTVQVNFTGVGNAADDDSAFVTVTTFSGVNQTAPLLRTNTASGTSGAGSIILTSTNNDLVFATLAVDDGRTPTAGGGQTTLWNSRTETGADGCSTTGSTKPGAASVTNSWTFTSDAWAAIAVSVRPAPAAGGTNVAVFSQSPNFCSSFALPSNSVVSVSNYVTVTSGSLGASPAVTATLKYGATTFAQLTNAAFNSASNWIVWSGILTSNVTVPAGQAISLTVTNSSSASFRVDYDSAAKPSKIALPTTTVINVDNFAVYDAPYPGGSVVVAPTAGALLYVRATVSDPFGAYDITSLGLGIDGPGVADDLNTTLTNAVASDSCSKTYEFAWQTGTAPGGFNLSATANEGTEGITATANTSLTLTFLDLGTPSTTVFTTGNGTVTNAFPANTNVCVRVSDSDQNTNATTIDFISVTITSSSGDSETLTLAETSTNSGIFTGCIPASTSGGSGGTNGTLNAPAGSVLNVTYTDPDDPTDVSSASGSVLTPPGVPGIAVSKTLIAPADGQAGVGEALQFNIQVVNTGSTSLTNVAVTDTFPAANFTYVSASVTPNIIGAGSLSWTNLGIFTPGQSLTLTVNFTASAVAASAVNSATASGTGATNTDTASVSITRSALTITKSLLNPTNGPVPVGSNITYRITVQNSGTVAIPTLPLEDTFSAAQLQFVSATNLAPDGVGAGSLLWNDITGAGSLAASNTLTIDVTMKVVGSGEPTLNTASADYAVDANGDPVPSASGNVGITTGAARITGHVYDDPNQNGTNDVGELGLSGVTLELYSDPNADGNLADGTLIRLVTTGGAGDYELLNLTTGAFVVVETDLSGYASSFPANNRRSVNITGLTTNANIDFFDYIPAVTNYATISGAVWSDTNNNAVLNVGEPGLGNVTVELIQDVNTNGLADLGEPTVDSAITGTNGAFTFYSVVPGNYVLKETDLFGYVSTADSQGANDNQVALTVGNSAVATNNYFLDWFTGNFPGNDVPVAVNDSYSVNEDTVLNIAASGVLTNDTDVDGDTLSAVPGTTTPNGTLTLNPNGSFTYTPNTNFVGVDTFTYRANDGTTNSALATVTITVNAVNDAPVANNQAITTPEDTSTNLVLTASDVDNTNLVFAILSGPTHGSLGVLNTNTGAVTYSPSNNYHGPDGFTFTVFDGSLYATGTVSITVTPVNDPPVAVNDSATTPEDTQVAIPALLNDSDLDGDPLSLVEVLSADGIAIISGTNVLYTPSTNFNGTNIMTYSVTDGTATNTALITVIVTPVNDAPVVTNQSVTIPEDGSTNLVLTASDVDNTNLTFAILTGPANGLLGTLNTNTGAVSYSANTNYVGADSFTFTVFDGSLYATGTVSITVAPVNDAPLANNLSVTIPEDTSTNLVFTASDVDNTNLVFSILAGPASGSLGVLNTNTGAVTYSPNANYVGGDSFTFTVFDGSLYATGTVSITVTPVNDAPTAFSQSVTNLEDTALPITLTGADVDGPVTNFVLVSLPLHGSLSGSGANLTYTPTNNYNGPDSFTFTVNDGSLTSTVATVSITVLPVNDAPVANDDSYSLFKNTTLNISASGVLTNDTDVEGSALTAVLVANVAHGTLALSTNGGFTYTPSNNYVGPDSFTYRANDGTTNSGIATVTLTVLATNTAPVAVNDSYAVNEDNLLTVPVSGVLTNDTDVDANPLTAVLVATTTNGTLNLNANGSFTYLPGTNFSGTDHFTYHANDGATNSAIATVTITVNAVNDGPAATNLSVTTPEDTSTNLVLTGSDVDNTNLVFAILTGPTHGTLGTLNTNSGAVTYSPSNNYVGPDSFTFTVFDGALYATGSVAITVTPVNDPPVAVNDNATVNEDSTNSIPVLVNDSDPDGDPLTLVSVVTTNGTATIVGTNVVYTPATNFYGTNVLTYCVTDGAATNCALITVVVTPVNDAPVANNQSVTMPEDTSTNLVLAASDVDNASLTFSILSNPTSGSLGVLNTNTGAVTYSPNANYVGADGFTFTVFDGSLYATGTVSITVTPVNDAPVAISQSVTNLEDTALPITLTGADVDGPVTNFVLVGLPLHGSLSGSGANLTYTPTNNYNGPDSFTFTVNDGSLTSAVATVSITVLPVNDAPVANSQSLTNAEDTALPITLTGSDVDGPVTNFVLVSLPSHGSLSGSGANLTYTPTNNYNGPDAFTFTVNDGSLTSAVATVSITVTPVNDAPVANSQSVTNLEDTPLPITLTGADVDGPVTNFVLVGLPTHGSLSGSGANLTYTPTNNYNGPDSVTFTVNDGSLTSAVATVSITVLPVNDAPVANNDAYSTFKNVTLNIGALGVLTNDTDVEGGALTAALVADVSHGTLSLSTNGGFTYTPSNNYVGPDSFTYRANDGASNSAIATVTLTITATNIAPVAVNDSYSVNEDSVLTVPVSGVLTNDTDADADALTATIVATTTNGLLSLNANGGFTYTPNSNFFGVDHFTYRANDALTNSGIATVTITVNAVNDAPVATNLAVTTPEDTSTNLVVSGSDVDNTNLTYAVLTSPTHGTLGTLNTNTGAVTYSPSNNYNGPDSFTFTVFDGSLYATGTVSITVTPVNDPPVAVSDFATTPEDVPVNIPALLNDNDPDGDALTIISVATTNGSYAFNATNINYRPSTNFFGTNVMTYTITDGAFTNSAQITVVVTPVNDQPVASNQSLTLPEDTSLAITLTGSDVDGPVTNFVLVGLPLHGSLSGSGANLTYTPTNNYNGPDSFTFTVNDGSLTSAVATVSITVTPVNDPPIAVNDNATVNEDSTNSIPVLVNDTDPDGNPLTIASVSSTNGTATINGTNVIYTPSPNFSGTNVINYCISDGAATNCATITVIVLPVNDAPTAFSQSVTNLEDTALPITLTGADVDGPVTNFVLAGLPLHGSLSGSGANLTYTPTNNYNGPDSFTFTVNDGSLTSAVATVSITVLPVNDAPVANSQSLTNAEDTALPITLTGSDVDGPVTNFVLVGLPTHGLLSGSGANLTYTPSNNYVGPDAFTFTVNDGSLTSSVATVSIVVTQVNDAPAANNLSVTIPEDTSTNLVVSGSDIDSSNLVYAVLGGPAHGSLGVLNTNTGAVTYSPSNNYVGPDSFTFTVFDGSLYATGTVSITVTPVNDAPTAVNDAYSVFQGSILTVLAGGVLTNDTDVESNALTAVFVSNPAHGTLSLSTNGGFVYTPTNAYAGPDSFTYRASDGISNSSIATVSITVVPVADIAVTKTGPSTVTPSVNFNYTITVTNLGLSTASNVVTFDSLPTNLTFVAASSGGVLSNNVVRWPTVTNFAKGFVTNYTITVTTPTNGSFINVAYATSTTADPDSSNNDGSAGASRVTTTAAPVVFGIRQGTNVFNPQTGLYEQSVTITNLSGSTVAALQLLVGDIRGTNGVLRTNVWLWNANGTNVDGRRYVQYNSPLDPGSNVTLRLEFYNPARTPFTNSLEVVATLPVPATTNLSGGVAIDVAFADNRIPGEPRFVIEWVSIPGRNYTVIYSSSVNGPWTAATPSVNATANRTQWYDDGPPKTISKPLGNGSRYYRVILNP